MWSVGPWLEGGRASRKARRRTRTARGQTDLGGGSEAPRAGQFTKGLVIKAALLHSAASHLDAAQGSQANLSGKSIRATVAKEVAQGMGAEGNDGQPDEII